MGAKAPCPKPVGGKHENVARLPRDLEQGERPPPAKPPSVKGRRRGPEPLGLPPKQGDASQGTCQNCWLLNKSKVTKKKAPNA